MLQLPDSEHPVWRDAYPAEPAFPQLITTVKADTVIIGGGITGLSAAYQLIQSGKSVVVLEKDTIGSGTTGRTTGKVTSQHGLSYAYLWKTLGQQVAKDYADANQWGVEQVAKIIRHEKIDCEWETCNNFVFTDNYDSINYLKHEAEIAHDLGLPAKFVTDTPLPFTIKGAMRFERQGKFHSQKYLLGLANYIDNTNKSHVFEKSRAIGIREGGSCRVTTMRGAVEAKHIIVATHVPTSPLLARAGYALLEYPTESFAVAGPLERPLSDMYKSPDDNHYSILPTSIDNKPMLLIVGAGGNIPGLSGDTSKRFQSLANYAEKRFNVRQITHKWSDMDYIAYDNIPLVGKLYPWSKQTYTASGYRKWGLSMGTAAGKIIADLIVHKKNHWSETFNTIRSRPIKRIPKAAFNYMRNSV